MPRANLTASTFSSDKSEDSYRKKYTIRTPAKLHPTYLDVNALTLQRQGERQTSKDESVFIFDGLCDERCEEGQEEVP